MTKEPKWTKEQEVYEVRHSGQIVKEKISKIYKNGNFILTRHKSQYRQSGYGTREWSNAEVLPINDETTARYNLYVQRDRAEANMHELYRIDLYKLPIEALILFNQNLVEAKAALSKALGEKT